MKKIALFGGTGQTGKEFLKLAIPEGYSIKMLVRSLEKAQQYAPHVELIQGDVLNKADVEKTVKGTDVVVSLFGHVKGSPRWLQTNGTQNIIESMKKHSVERIISLSGGGLPFPEKDKPKLPDHLIRGIMKLFVPKVLEDAVKHAEVLEESGLKWTIVRGPRLTNDAAKGEYRVGWVGVNAGTKVTRADLSDFILKEVKSEAFNYQMPFVTQ